jgi:hypothetical protein
MNLGLLSDVSKTAKELSIVYGVHPITIHRWRKKYGIKVPNGSKKGKSKPWLITSIEKECKTCQTKFMVTPSRKNVLCCSRRCLLQCQEYREKFKQIDRTYMQSDAYRKAKSKETTPDYKKYAGRVHRLSQKIYEKNVDILNPTNEKRTRCGVQEGYQLDHILSIRYGFENNIPAEEIAKLENLQLLPWKENLLKR